MRLPSCRARGKRYLLHLTMAKLTAEQQKSVAQWAADGATLNEIQDRLKHELDLTMTYMETRLLVMELGLKLIDKPKEKPPEPTSQPSAQEAEAQPERSDAYGDDFESEGDLPPGEPPFEDDAEASIGGGNVSVSLDTLTVPGAMVSGKATFSDGKTAGWHLDQYGRLGLRTPEPGYQPPPADIPAFQREVQRLLQKQGY